MVVQLDKFAERVIELYTYKDEFRYIDHISIKLFLKIEIRQHRGKRK